MKIFIPYLVLVCCVMQSFAQVEIVADDSLPNRKTENPYILGLFPKEEPQALRSFQVNGFYRFFGTYTEYKQPYLLDANSSTYTAKRNVFIGDDAQLPNLWMNVTGKPSSNTTFGMDVFMFQFLDGNLNPAYTGQTVDSLRPTVYDPINGNRLAQTLGLNLGINLYGTYDASFGSFEMRMGGIHWYYLSDLTFASFRGYNRFTLFERNPWDPVMTSRTDRYNKFYSDGATEQDLRWGNRAFQGLIIDATELPKNISFSFLHGKTEFNGGFGQLPNTSTGGRLKKTFNSEGYLSYNTFNSRTYTDSTNTSSIGFNVHTLEFNKKWSKFSVHSEIGAGRYYSPSNDEGFGEAVSVKLNIPNLIKKTPLEIQYYRIAPEVLNNNALYWNTAIVEPTPNATTAGSAGVLTPFASSMTVLGQMTNNRTGLNVNTEVKLGKLKVGLGYGVAAEIEAISNTITYSHFVNQLTRSRFWRWNFPNGVGPYNRYNVAYRDAYEVVQLTDSVGGLPLTNKKFNNLEIQAKYKTKLAKKDLFVYFLGRYNTIQPDFSPLPQFRSTDPYIKLYSSELELYYSLSPSFIWTNYIGYERVIANRSTELDVVSGKPRNQEGVGIGTGFEVTLAKNALFILRHRWFSLQDFNFSLDQAKGKETLVELKVFF